MKRKLKYYRLVWLKHDFSAGLSVFLVALPLCLGISLASGTPLYSGLLSGIIGGVVVSWISGSNLSVSGPAAGLTTLVSASVLLLGNYEIFLLSVIIAGLFQVLLGVLKLGTIANYFPSSVIKGMLAAIGIILISKQIPLAIGYAAPNFWTSGFLDLFTGNFVENIKVFQEDITLGSVIITLITFLFYYLYKQPFAEKIHFIPMPLIVVIIGILFNFIFSNFIPVLALSKQQLVNVPSNIFADMAFPDFSKLFDNLQIWKSGLVIGLLATLETLLCVEAVDKLDKHNRITPVNRELIAQGIGNMTCGLLGAIPMTAVVVRGAANVSAGGKTNLSAFTHGIFLLIAVLVFPFLLNQIPYASLSVILLITGYNLTKPKLYKSMIKLGWKQFMPFIITVFVILSTDLLEGVFIGLLISIYFIIQNNFKTEYKITSSKQRDTEIFFIKLNSNVTFLNKVKLRQALDQIPEYSVLTIDGSDCNFIDYDIIEIISEYHNKAHDRHISVFLKGIAKVNITAMH